MWHSVKMSMATCRGCMRSRQTVNTPKSLLFMTRSHPINALQDVLRKHVMSSSSRKRISAPGQRLWMTTATSTRGPLGKTALAAFACSGAYFGYRWVSTGEMPLENLSGYFGNEKVEEEEADSPPMPQDEFSHPFQQKSLIWRVFLVGKRIVLLGFCFAPFLAASMMLMITGSPEWRSKWVESLVASLERAGCSFQKFGQWLSMRPDMLAADIIEGLSRLRQGAPSHSMEHTRAVIKEALGKELEEVFVEWDETPIASGTIAQIYRATLRPEYALQGREVCVAVKVRHPNVLAETYCDIDLIFAFITGIGEFVGHLTIPFHKDEFHRVLQRQVDLRWEAYNLSRFRHNFAADTDLRFPRVSAALLSPALLVESWVPGESVSGLFSAVGDRFIPLTAHHIDNATLKSRASGAGGGVTSEAERNHRTKKALARTVFDMAMKMFLRDNFVHGDLHGGNLIHPPPAPAASADGEPGGTAGARSREGTVVVIDGGLVTSIDPEYTRLFNRFLSALCRGDADELVGLLIRFKDPSCIEAPKDGKAFHADVSASISRWVGADGKAPDGGVISMGDLLGELLFRLQQHRVFLRGDVASSIVTMSLTEGLVRQLDPDFDVVRHAAPYFRRFKDQLAFDEARAP